MGSLRDGSGQGLGAGALGCPSALFRADGQRIGRSDRTWLQTGYVKTHKHIDSTGSPQVFEDPDAINNGIAVGTPVRFPYPGEAGQRNNFRGDGFFGIDSALAKNWNITERQAIRFTWEVFNVSNSVRFDTNPQSSAGGLTTQAQNGGLGKYASTLTNPRIQQFSLRYSF